MTLTRLWCFSVITKSHISGLWGCRKYVTWLITTDQWSKSRYLMIYMRTLSPETGISCRKTFCSGLNHSVTNLFYISNRHLVSRSHNCRCRIPYPWSGASFYLDICHHRLRFWFCVIIVKALPETITTWLLSMGPLCIHVNEIATDIIPNTYSNNRWKIFFSLSTICTVYDR